MALHNENDDRRQSLYDEAGAAERASWLGWIALLAVLIGVGTLAYRHFDFISDNVGAKSAVENPVTSPAVPKSQ